MLNISRQIQTGWDQVGTIGILPEAEIIPIGNTANEKRKLQGLTNRKKFLKEFENIPLPGFTLLKSERKSWGSIDQTWLVIDPRGFMFRITPNNLEKILQVTGITEGLIQEKCVWAREDSQTKMILVPITSEDYIDAVANTEMIEGKIDLKSVGIGDTVLTQGKIKGEYMGSISLYGPVQCHTMKTGYKPQVFMRRQVIKVEKNKYFYQTDAKILKVIEKAKKPMTREESAEQINNELKTGKVIFSTTSYFIQNYYSTRCMITYASTHAVPKVPMFFVEIDRPTTEQLFVEGYKNWDNGLLVLVDSNGKKFLIEHPSSSYLSNKYPIDMNNFEVMEISNDLTQSTETLTPVIQANSTYNSYSVRANKHIMKSLDNFVKFYKIVKNVKTETYL